MLKKDYKVYAAARRVEKMGDLKGKGAIVIGMDVTKDEQVEAGVEQVIKECMEAFQRKEIQEKAEPNIENKLIKKLFKFTSKYNGKYHQELIPFERVRSKLTYRNYAVY